jgi:hypothetical protein
MPVVINGTTGITTPDLDSTADISANGVVFGEGGGSVITNTVAGAGALASNTTAGSNTAVGYQALNLATTAIRNTAVGANTLDAATTGQENTAVGWSALSSLTTGQYNVAYGQNAGGAVTTANGNTLIGLNAGLLATGGNNTFIGALSAASEGAGQNMTTGTRNTIIGAYSGNQNGLDLRTSNSNIVLSDGDGIPRQIIDGNGRTSTGVQDGGFGQFGKGYSSWANVSSHTMNIANLFPLLPVGGAGMTIMMQIITQSGANNATAYYAMAKRNIDQSGWAFSVIASQASGPTISFSGSANSITLTFSFGNQYGKCMLDVLCAT